MKQFIVFVFIIAVTADGLTQHISKDPSALGDLARRYYRQQFSKDGESIGGGTEPEAITVRFFTGAAAGDYFGYSVAGAGDVNGDGYSDVIVGAPYNDAGGTDAGRVYVYFGGPLMDTRADVTLTSGAAGDYLGTSVSTAGDVNGDGYNDVIVGASFDDAGGTNAGRAYICFGGASMDHVADVILTGAAAGDYLGASVSTAGDMNGDGYNDVIVGAPQNDAGGTNAGRAYIYFGGASIDNTADVILTGAAAGDLFGDSVAPAGDVNGDGYSDVIVGADGNDAVGTNAGRAYIYFGGASVNNTADVILTGAATNDYFGVSVAPAGDVNGDGYNDVIVGAIYNDAGGTNAGRAYIYFGGASMDNTADVILTGAVSGDYFGFSVAGAGDVNGDGYSDVIVGALYNDAGGTDAGRAYIYLGGASMDNVAEVILTGDLPNDNFGFSVAAAGDVNGDGYTDVIAGAQGNDAGAGRAYLYMNSLTGTDIADEFFTGAAPNDGLGFSVNAAGDVNGDGYTDVIVGAPVNDAGGSAAGRAYIYFGGPKIDNRADVILTGHGVGDGFGFSVATAGDVNGDGYSDVIVGAPIYYAGGTDEGRAFIYFGGAPMDNWIDVILTGAATNDWFGVSVAPAGDVNGDGYTDVIVGAVFNDAGGSAAGRAYIYFGGASIDNMADVILTGAVSGDRFGSSVAPAGDVNGDGHNDVIVGAPQNDAGGTNAGRAYIYFGGASIDNTADVTLTGAATNDDFGSSVAPAGDVNGDGYNDVIVGAWSNDAGGSDAGRAYIYFGGASMDGTADVILTGAMSGDHFGSSVATAGDVNGDGYTDVIVGAVYNDAGGTDAGRAYIYFGGASIDNMADVILTGAMSGDHFGSSVAPAGHVNRDGYGDVIVGAVYNDAGGTDAGRAYLYISSSPPIIPRFASVKDVPNDQGGNVSVRWIRSGYDVRGIARITDYVVQRSFPPGIGGFAWENLTIMPATQEPQYSYVASTPYDSMTNTSGTFYFRVTARTSNANEYWRSNIMSGHSVDNLAPGTPLNALLLAQTQTRVRLRWDRNSHDPDVARYVVYRDTTSGFVCADSTRYCTTTDTTVVDSILLAGKSYFYRITTRDIHGNESTPTTQLMSPNALTSRATFKLMLEGPFNTGTGLMNTTLNTSGILGTRFPGVVIPTNAVDSITIELRNAALAPTTRKYRGAWLLADGTIRMFTDSTKNYVEFDTLAGNYYLVIHHRNHLAIMTSAPEALNGVTPPAYDFTIAQNRAYGTNPMKSIASGQYALYTGDANQSGIISAADANNIFGLLNQTGYHNADVNLSGIVTAADANIVFANLNQASQVPGGALDSSLSSTEEPSAPAELSLFQNYPNPFNPATTIEFALPKSSHVKLEVFNTLGQRVAELVNETRETGYYSERLDASHLATGVYIYRLQAGDFAKVRKLLVLK